MVDAAAVSDSIVSAGAGAVIGVSCVDFAMVAGEGFLRTVFLAVVAVPFAAGFVAGRVLVAVSAVAVAAG